MALTNKQRVFIAEYVIDFNATRAAIAAGYSEHTAHATGWENLRKPEIAEEIEKVIDHRCMTKSEVLVRLAEHARGDMADFWEIPEDGDPYLNLAGERAKGKTHLIKKLKVKKTVRTIKDEHFVTTETDMELYDAQAADALIGRHHKLFTDKLDVDLSGSVEITADQRAKAQKELDVWQQGKKKNAVTSNG